MKLSADRLRSIIDYDPDTGVFRWLWDDAKPARINSRDTKKAAGSIGVDGRRAIKISGTRYYCSRLAWLYMFGVWPTDQIDHINCDKSDDRIANLRECSGAQNHLNVGLTVRNRSGYKGVHWNGRYQKWEAAIRINGVRHYLGRYDAAEDAARRYAAAAVKYHNEFARIA